MFILKKGTLKFLLNSCLDTLPTQPNLLQWGKSASDLCKLCLQAVAELQGRGQQTKTPKVARLHYTKIDTLAGTTILLNISLNKLILTDFICILYDRMEEKRIFLSLRISKMQTLER